MDIAKGLLDNGIHPPTMYFPLIVEEALMVEPTETESKETLDEAVEVLRKLYEIAETDAEQLLLQHRLQEWMRLEQQDIHICDTNGRTNKL